MLGLNQPAKILDQVMSTPVLSASVKTNIREICNVMFNHHIGALPIGALPIVLEGQLEGQSGVLAGMITRSDILRAMIKHGPVQLWI
jgi:acetoin utilization protein AcuB